MSHLTLHCVLISPEHVMLHTHWQDAAKSSAKAFNTVCREYDRLEAEALKQRCKPKYSLASEDHQILVKSTVDLACNPKLKGRIPSAIREALANAASLEELTIGLVGLRFCLHPSGLYLGSRK